MAKSWKMSFLSLFLVYIVCVLRVRAEGDGLVLPEVPTTVLPAEKEAIPPAVPTDFVNVFKDQQNQKNLTKTDFENEIIPTSSPSVADYREALLARLEKEIGNWTDPEFLAKKYPYYLSGFDDEERPIWISELGKFDMRAIAEAGPEMTDLFDKYVLKSCLRMVGSHTLRNKLGNTLVYLLDFEGLQFSQLASLPTVTYLLHLAREYRALLEDHTHLAVVVNANFVTETLVNMVRPIFGKLLESVKIYGNNKAKWLPQVLKHFPQDQIPEWYGGIKGYKPVAIYG